MVATILDGLNVISGNYLILAGRKGVALTGNLAGRELKKEPENKGREDNFSIS